MRILIAEDEPVTQHFLQSFLVRQGHEPVVASNGEEAWQILDGPAPPGLAILDWMMPGLEGLEVCRRVRSTPALRGLYIVLLTSRGERESVLQGLQAGANDYLTKPFDPDELAARLRVAAQVVELQNELAARVHALEVALAQVKRLQGLLPICSYCKKIRDDKNYWHQVDRYMKENSDIKFSHGVCPECLEKVVRPEYAKLGIRLPDAFNP